MLNINNIQYIYIYIYYIRKRIFTKSINIRARLGVYFFPSIPLSMNHYLQNLCLLSLVHISK